jgi:hypothetical protein
MGIEVLRLVKFLNLFAAYVGSEVKVPNRH